MLAHHTHSATSARRACAVAFRPSAVDSVPWSQRSFGFRENQNQVLDCKWNSGKNTVADT